MQPCLLLLTHTHPSAVRIRRARLIPSRSDGPRFLHRKQILTGKCFEGLYLSDMPLVSPRLSRLGDMRPPPTLKTSILRKLLCAAQPEAQSPRIVTKTHPGAIVIEHHNFIKLETSPSAFSELKPTATLRFKHCSYHFLLRRCLGLSTARVSQQQNCIQLKNS